MKKINYFILILFTVLLGFSSCNSCQKESKPVDVVTETEMIVENVTSTDKQYMFTTYGNDYRWFETCIKLVNYLDEENDGKVESITNVFQVVYETQESGHTCADVYVIFANHTADSTAYEVKEGFWVEDMPMNDDAIKLTFKDAFEKLMQTNMPKPHSKNCVLRKPVGSVECNPQYVFGNTHETIWVDAVTGEVSETNPAFPPELKKPLGEWP